MKQVILTLTLVSLLSFSVSAQNLPNPGVTPDSWMYGLDRAFEKISLALTFDKVKKAEKRLLMASERIAELKAMVDKGKPEFVDKLRSAYENGINETENDIEAARALGKNVTLLAEHVSNMTYKHVLVLQGLLDKVPEQARPSIERAINVSQTGHERAVERVRNQVSLQARNKNQR